jgi:tRNA/rRNA methyltransferase
MTSTLSHITIVLVRPQQSGNIGVAARAIANHGIGQLALVDPPNFDPERARWMAPKSHHVIDGAHYCASVSEAVVGAEQVIATTARPRAHAWPVLDPRDVSERIAEAPIPTAILFGPEDCGLSNEDLALAEALLHFPTTDAVSSLNLGQAVTATASALATAQRHHQAEPQAAASDLAPVERREELVQRMVGVLDASGYLNGRPTDVVSNTLIRLAGRSALQQEELNQLMGMVKQLDWWFKAQSH